jgi:hypothetical protein
MVSTASAQAAAMGWMVAVSRTHISRLCWENRAHSETLSVARDMPLWNCASEITAYLQRRVAPSC